MPGMQRDMAEHHAQANDHTEDRADSPNGVYPTETLDAVIVRAGFAGVYILVRQSLLWRIDQQKTTNIRNSTSSVKQGSKRKIIEAGAGLGGIWWYRTHR